jgi:acetolactate synthase-1/2/3 large subunit
MRAILCLFEGVASGAADGYARMADKPAATLLHLGSGFANSMANQHNAMRAHVPLLNLVGNHASWHLEHDAPLTSDVAAHARIPSAWVRTSGSADDLAHAAAEAVQASMHGAGGIATLIVPADHAWGEAKVPASPLPAPAMQTVAAETIERVAGALRSGKPAALFLGGRALRENALDAAGRIARAKGARLLCETFPTRLQRGAGRVKVERLPYFGEEAMALLQPFELLVLAGAKAPVSFFAYPGKPSWLTPEHCAIETLGGVDEDLEGALLALADALQADDPLARVQPAPPPVPPDGPLTPVALAQSLAAALPEHAIVADESNTCGLALFPLTEHAAAHDWLTLTGGAIGIGLPLALGAAIACPDRKVIALEADGSAMYTLQALWTMARENLDVTVLIFANRTYNILRGELTNVGVRNPGPRAVDMLSIDRPELGWVELARGMGVEAVRAADCEGLARALSAGLAHRGPFLVELVM